MLWEWKQIVSATETEVLQRAPSKGDLPAFVYSELARPVNITRCRKTYGRMPLASGFQVVLSNDLADGSDHGHYGRQAFCRVLY